MLNLEFFELGSVATNHIVELKGIYVKSGKDGKPSFGFINSAATEDGISRLTSFLPGLGGGSSDPLEAWHLANDPEYREDRGVLLREMRKDAPASEAADKGFTWGVKSLLPSTTLPLGEGGAPIEIQDIDFDGLGTDWKTLRVIWLSEIIGRVGVRMTHPNGKSFAYIGITMIGPSGSMGGAKQGASVIPDVLIGGREAASTVTFSLASVKGAQNAYPGVSEDEALQSYVASLPTHLLCTGRVGDTFADAVAASAETAELRGLTRRAKTAVKPTAPTGGGSRPLTSLAAKKPQQDLPEEVEEIETADTADVADTANTAPKGRKKRS